MKILKIEISNTCNYQIITYEKENNGRKCSFKEEIDNTRCFRAGWNFLTPWKTPEYKRKNNVVLFIFSWKPELIIKDVYLKVLK